MTVRTTSGAAVIALRPTFAEFVLKMKRGAQVVYPKDLAMIVLHGDVYPGANVLEAGAGSGALTMALVRAVGPEGRVVTYELREDFAALARANVEAFLGKTENLEIKIGSVYEPVEETDIDRVVLTASWRPCTRIRRGPSCRPSRRWCGPGTSRAGRCDRSTGWSPTPDSSRPLAGSLHQSSYRVCPIGR